MGIPPIKVGIFTPEMFGFSARDFRQTGEKLSPKMRTASEV